ncbi:AAA-domain-containing protein [Melanomma pulvis-pyrius CBS 109.77]|uniref:AAA-domain-containing protein n=1 Tax=Melanomma pulvis-pyrius CBS 109.77 TaxID=1314802 RepID=A0A6A6X868_9PLEO|nr:AAA-domain-containing protein [Melanomma pulvis-pyrius CBS 109.77]
MYAVVRPALRSASLARPPVRLINYRRYPSTFRLRSFHNTPSVAQTPNPPSPDSIPADENDVDKTEREKAALEATAEQAEAGVANEDPEIIAQKLQRSKEMTRRYTSALRRTQRRNRAQDLPPIHIPDWFLKSRVNLREDFPADPGKEKVCSLTITHTESREHATVSIPFWSYARGVRNLSEMARAMWKKGMSDEDRKVFARDFARRIGVQDDLSAVKALEHGEELKPAAEEDRHSGETFAESFEAKNIEEATEVGVQRFNERVEQLKREVEPKDKRYAAEQNRSGRRISPLILAEIRATIAASLSSVHTAAADSFPSSKTNLILHSPSNEHEDILVKNLFTISSELETDIVTLHPQDLAHLIGDYIGEGPEPSPHSIRSLGYETYKFGSEFANDIEELGSEEGVEEEQDTSAEQSAQPESFPGFPPRGAVPRFMLPIIAMSPVITSLRALTQTLKSSSSQGEHSIGSASNQPPRIQTQNEVQLEDLKISTFLEALIDANEVKRSRGLSATRKNAQRDIPSSVTSKNVDIPDFFNYSVTEGAELDLSSLLPAKATSDFRFTVNVQPSSKQSKVPPKSTIVYIMDIKELNATQYGSRILQKLEDIVRKRRSAGENIMLVGTTCSLDLTPELSSAGVNSLQSEGDAGVFRTIVVPIAPLEDLHTIWTPDDIVFDMPSAARAKILEQSTSIPEKRKIQQINLWHIQDMLQRLDPVAAMNLASGERNLKEYRPFHPVFPRSYFWRVLSYDEVHRIALTALGLHLMDPSSAHLSWTHVALSMGLLKASDEVKSIHVRNKAAERDRKVGLAFTKRTETMGIPKGLEALRKGSKSGNLEHEKAAKRRHDLDRVAATATKHEKRLMPGIANPEQIKTTFDQIHVPKDTVEAIRTLTSLSLLRPDAFNYGVLATEKISGALLYGPPGTGKTLLAKAVAKESGSMVLEVSGSSIMDKYVGEGEKNVSAIFSLARKLSPCIVFLDEADAIFASRNSGRERTSHRDILNQFLKEWDGLNDLSVFVMVATNRPFDLDDAVIRRLPRRLLVDLPAQDDRREILKIHLRGEQLDESVDLEDLAKRTPLYSGSDLKNIAVSAALACVKEENENAAIAVAKAATEAAANEAVNEAEEVFAEESMDAAETSPPSSSPQDTANSSSPSPSSSTTTTPLSLPQALSNLQSLSPPRLVRGQNYSFPEKRTLHARHFDKALQEISASISEDMSSLNAVKKFDEQYGDRKGRRKKNAYGFGVSKESEREGSARVRI